MELAKEAIHNAANALYNAAEEYGRRTDYYRGELRAKQIELAKTQRTIFHLIKTLERMQGVAERDCINHETDQRYIIARDALKDFFSGKVGENEVDIQNLS